MTREEAIKGLEKLRTQYATAAEIGPTREYRLLFKEAADVLDAALAALRGPTREQVEKVWKGEWINKHSAYDHKIFTCAQCGKQISIQGENLDFCPKCGSAQTDEAVDIVMKRLEKLYEDR